MKAKILVAALFVILVSVIVLHSRDWSECSFEQEYATQRIIEMLKKANLDPAFLSDPSFQKEDCSYSYIYENKENKIVYIFTSWGEINRWAYTNGEGP